MILGTKSLCNKTFSSSILEIARVSSRKKLSLNDSFEVTKLMDSIPLTGIKNYMNHESHE